MITLETLSERVANLITVSERTEKKIDDFISEFHKSQMQVAIMDAKTNENKTDLANAFNKIRSLETTRTWTLGFLFAFGTIESAKILFPLLAKLL